MSDRTLKLTTPPMTGGDVELLQRDLNAELKRWRVPLQIEVDGVYGMRTRSALKSVLYGLGVPIAAIERGVTPQIRLKVRHRRLTRDELARYRARADWRDRLRRRHQDPDLVGPVLAIEYARRFIGTTESPPGSNRGPVIDQWNRAVGTPPGPWAFWCGAFVNACLVAAGFPSEQWLRYCPWIEQRARGGVDGWRWAPADAKPRPGWLCLFTVGTVAGHVELVEAVQDDGRPLNIGGNTGGGPTGSQNNGGGVYRRADRQRTGSFPIRGYAIPPYARVQD